MAGARKEGGKLKQALDWAQEHLIGLDFTCSAPSLGQSPSSCINYLRSRERSNGQDQEEEHHCLGLSCYKHRLDRHRRIDSKRIIHLSQILS